MLKGSGRHSPQNVTGILKFPTERGDSIVLSYSLDVCEKKKYLF